MKDYYRILQVSPSATQAEIKRAYRKLVKMHHPDVVAAQEPALSIQEILEAYAVLGKPDRRQTYDWKFFKPAEEEPVPTVYFAGAGHPPPVARQATNRWVVSCSSYVCPLLKLSLAFCLLLLLDYALPVRKKLDQIKYVIEGYAEEYRAERAKEAGSPQDAEVHTFSGRIISIPPSAGAAFAGKPNLLVFHTPIFRKPLYIAPAKDTNRRFRIDRSIYGRFAYIPFMLLLLSALGLYKGVRPRLRLAMGAAAVLLLLVAIGLLVV